MMWQPSTYSEITFVKKKLIQNASSGEQSTIHKCPKISVQVKDSPNNFYQIKKTYVGK